MSFKLIEDARAERILNFLTFMDDEFYPPLRSRVNLAQYAQKLADHGINFFLRADNEDVAHAGFYCNDESSGIAFISSIAVVPQCQGSGAAVCLLHEVVAACRARRMSLLSLEVEPENAKAVRFYEKQGFRFVSARVMQKNIGSDWDGLSGSTE